MTAGLDKTSVSNSDKVNQRLSQSKEEGSDDILLENEPVTNKKSAEGPDEYQPLQKTPFDFSNRRASHGASKNNDVIVSGRLPEEEKPQPPQLLS